MALVFVSSRLFQNIIKSRCGRLIYCVTHSDYLMVNIEMINNLFSSSLYLFLTALLSTVQIRRDIKNQINLQSIFAMSAKDDSIVKAHTLFYAIPTIMKNKLAYWLTNSLIGNSLNWWFWIFDPMLWLWLCHVIHIEKNKWNFENALCHAEVYTVSVFSANEWEFTHKKNYLYSTMRKTVDSIHWILLPNLLPGVPSIHVSANQINL